LTVSIVGFFEYWVVDDLDLFDDFVVLTVHGSKNTDDSVRLRGYLILCWGWGLLWGLRAGSSVV